MAAQVFSVSLVCATGLFGIGQIVRKFDNHTLLIKKTQQEMLEEATEYILKHPFRLWKVHHPALRVHNARRTQYFCQTQNYSKCEEVYKQWQEIMLKYESSKP